MARQIAFVEDDTELRQNYTEAIEREGYIVTPYSNRPEAQEAFSRKLPDMAILDIELEDERYGGFTLCRYLREKSETIPIIFLTAVLTRDIDRISGLRMGAIDFLLKDTSTLDILPEKISAFFRYLDAISKPVNEEENIVVGPLIVNEDRMEVTWKNSPIRLTVAEFKLLHALIKKAGNVKKHGDLMNANVEINTITANIKRLRDKFKEVDPEFNCIDTVHGMGYRWVT